MIHQRPMSRNQRAKLIEELARLEHWSADEFYKRMTALDNEYLHNDPSINRLVSLTFSVQCVVVAVLWFAHWYIHR